MNTLISLEAKFGFRMEEVSEGAAKFLVPKVKDVAVQYTPSKMPVFYNPRMEFNRDLAVTILQSISTASGHMLRICEPLAGCGVRGLRFALEVKGLEKIMLNDLNPVAAELTRVNVEAAGLKGLVEVHSSDANTFLAKFTRPGNRFDYIDIDPFGSPMPYIHIALKSLRNRGFLALTATDMPLLCGVQSKACLRRYSAKPIRAEYCHELAVRILVASAALTAAKMDLALSPIFCHSTDHYVRVYLQSIKSAMKADLCLGQLGYVLHCPRCLNRRSTFGVFPQLERHCPECRGQQSFAGPLWLGPLWNQEMLQRIMNVTESGSLGQKKRLRRLLERIMEEVEAPPTYYVLSRLCDFFDVPVPRFQSFLTRIKALGYHAYHTHFHPNGVKTDAPVTVLRQLLKG